MAVNLFLFYSSTGIKLAYKWPVDFGFEFIMTLVVIQIQYGDGQQWMNELYSINKNNIVEAIILTIGVTLQYIILCIVNIIILLLIVKTMQLYNYCSRSKIIIIIMFSSSHVRLEVTNKCMTG